MNRQEAAIIIKAIGKHAIETHLTDPGDIVDATVMAVQALVPKPDEVTGLVPCGCGGRPYIEQDDDYYMGGWSVDSPECEIWVPCFKDKDTLVKTWNTAMGWKGGAE